jgi:hypothetical protein
MGLERRRRSYWAVVFGVIRVVPDSAECFFGQTRGCVREVPFLIPNRQEVDEVLNLRHPFGRKASNRLDQGFFGNGGLGLGTPPDRRQHPSALNALGTNPCVFRRGHLALGIAVIWAE